MAATEPIRGKNDVSKMTEYFRKCGNKRNLALFVLSIHTALRVSDILNLSWDDVYDFRRKCVRNSIALVEKKTGKSKIIALNENIIAALGELAAASAAEGKAVILNPNTNKAISRIQAYRIIRAAAEEVELETRVSCHSLRKTFGYHAWKSGVSPAVIMDIYNHSSLTVTSRYLGVTQDDKNAVYLGMSY